jgi:U3 small nucleolar RNA-associated protein 18
MFHSVGRTEKSLEKMFVSACGNFVAFLGDNGSIILVSTKTKQWVSTLKMNGTVSDIAFSNDGDTLFSIGSDAEVYRWDLKSMECIGKLRDVGAIDPVRIAVSPDLKYLAIGLKCGIVNVYDMDGFSTEHSMVTLDPIKSIPNLTTAIHTLQFHPSSQMLLIGSRETKDCMRLVHLPSIQVFPNWPTQATPIGYLNCASFSPSGLYMTLGNAKGKCLLYSLESFLSS